TRFVQIVRSVGPKEERKASFANLQLAIEGDEAANAELQPNDEVFVFSREELNLRERVTIAGNVNKPGEYLWFDGMTLKDFVFMAGNVTKDAYLPNAEVARYRVESDGVKHERIGVNLNDVLVPQPSKNLDLQPNDQVFIRGIPNYTLS